MKKITLLSIMFMLLFHFSCAQNERTEIKLMDCTYASFSDKGKAFKEVVRDFEALLIEEGIIEDSSGKSYRDIFVRFAKDEVFNKTPSKHFSSLVFSLKSPNIDKLEKCQKQVKSDSVHYNASKLKDIERIMETMSLAKNLEIHMVAKEFLKVITEEDFELDYYKIRTFSLLELVRANDSGLMRKLPEVTATNEERDLSNALKIHIDADDQIFVEDKKVTIDALKEQVKTYEETNTSTSIFILTNERTTSYKKYIAVQNAIVGEIDKLRERLAKEQFNLDYNSLTKDQKTEIKKMYPKNITE